MGYTWKQVEELIKAFLAAIEEEKERTGLPFMRDEKTGDPLFVDQRELRLRYLIPVKGIEKFFEGLTKGEVRYNACSSCGLKYFPPQRYCSRCGSSDLAWYKIESDGELVTYTKIAIKPTSFLYYDDYIVGVARFPEGVSVVSWVKTTDVSDLKVGQRVKIKVERRQPDNYLTYVLEPVSA